MVEATINTLSIALVFFGIYLTFRNKAVYKERMRMLNRCEPGSDDFWKRHEEYEKYTYDGMLWRFWIPVKEFYKDYK